ncbi:zinc finger protein 462-like [Micropterus dolomieu]|uniref:zinc finger protein 462-like n=1 Tax=Micropterus dolomieu TaxID=147949 RepID=UPI001E8EE0CD|nr:zinc finger protein 462-like [Micropterus dolomieu]XP_045890322.1 zinc finger protein 462-like [Micropterus dolomieu]XP_045890323.1 zinc finger protein 462-like [Micropterus dolomieu]
MQKDSMHFSTSGQKTHNQAVTQETQINSFHCTQCTLIFKSKIYLFEHLNKVHGIDVDVALRDAGLKSSRTVKANTDSYGNSTGNPFECQNCAFKACSRELLNKHEKQCPNNSNINLIISENPETVISTNKHEEAAGAEEIMSTSKTKCTVNSSKDLKTYKRPLQTITKYFAPSSGSNGKSPVKVVDGSMLLDSTEGTLILQESPSISTPNSGVFKVTAKPTIDIAKSVSDNFLLNERLLICELKPQKPKEQDKETVPNDTGKRTSKESVKGPPAKKAKSDKEGTNLKSKQQSSNNPEFSFEVSEDEEEKRIKLVNGDGESPNVYFCKHCDYGNVGIGHVSTHYQTDHPYITHNTVYIQDPKDQSATFRCLECPVEFQSVAGLKSHYTENHPEAPDVFTMQSHEFRLVFKCFVCSFTTNSLKALKEHCKEKHPTHTVENSLMYCRYSATRCQEGSSRLNTCEKAPSPERPGGISPDGARTPSKEIKNATSPQHPTSKGADVALYHCNKCKFSHKSVVVMHVHYQKSHPNEAVTIDKIKQSARVMSQTTSQVTAGKSPNSVAEKSTPPKHIPESPMKTRNKVELSQQKKISLFMINPKHTAEASKIHSESSETERVDSARSKRRKSPPKPDREMSNGMDSLPSSSPNKLFYCQCCSYLSTNIRSVVSHHNVKHADSELTGIEDVLRYSAEVKEKKLPSDKEASATPTPSESKSRKQIEVCSENKLQHGEDDAAGASVTNLNAYQCAENLFYCQTCNFGTLSVKGILNHQRKVHQNVHYSKERIVEYTTLIRGEIEKSKSQAKELPFSTHLPLPLVNRDDEDVFFCHFCNYRQGTVDQVLRHYSKRHRGFVVKGKQVRLYTDMVLKQTRKSHLKTTANQEVSCASTEEKGNKKTKTKKLGKVTSSPSTRESPSTKTQRALQCYKCPYSTQYVYLLKRHIWKIHKIKRSVTAVLKVCYKQGTLQPGYHCDSCVFSHKKAEAVYKHYQEHHPGRSPSLEYVTSLLYVGPKTLPLKRKKPQIRHADGDGTDGSVSSQRSGKSETKTYSCRACSFKGSSMASIIHHYHAVHPWSVKEDGSVLDVINRKKPSANRQVEDHNEMSASFNTYQVPVEENRRGSSHEATAFTKMFKCPHCPEKFYTQRGVKVHCGIKHPEAVMEHVDEPQEQQSTSKTRVHVFKCPHCAYVNTIYQGVLTHCQMRHPALAARADSLHVDDAHVDDMKVRKGPGSRFSGYMCKTCPQICATLEKLKKHSEDHHETVANTLKQAPKPSAVSKIKQSKTHSNWGSVSKASFLSKKVYAVVRCQQCSYTCSAKIALDRHLRVHHKNAPVLKVQDCVHKCFLCSSSYFRKDSLRSHYTRKHGKEAFLKYFVPAYKKVREKPVPESTHSPLTSMTTEKNKILVYKCPRCPYVNASLHGILTHCQMRHPAFIARADKLKRDEILLTNMVGCTMGKGSNERGFVCNKCPEIHRSLKKLKIHLEKDHKKAEKRAETEKEADHGSQVSVLEAFTLKNQTSASAAEIGLSHQLGAPETCQPNTPLVKYQQSVYKCHICTYKGVRRRYLLCHYKKTHKFDAFTTFKLLERYNKRKHNKTSNPPEADSEESAPVKCKMCPNLMFDSSQLLIAHYSTFHISESMLDFIVLSQGSKRSTGLYKCALCNKQMNGTRKLCYHLDGHREREMRKEQASLGITTTPEAQSMEVCMQDELPTLETVEELARWNVTPAETFTLPASPLPSPSKPCDLEQPEQESREDKNTCKRCGRKFMSLKGLRSHERSHAAVAAIKKLDSLPTSALKHNINKYVIYKSGTTRPFVCSICSYRTTVMGLWSSHFMKNHQDVLVDPAETENQDEESAQMDDDEPPNLSEELNHLPDLDEEPEIIEKSSYLEPPDVQRQLSHYNLMARAGAQSKANMQETNLPENSLLHCEVCNFNTGHLSSMRRHYLNRHGKKILRCKDCTFFTWLRRSLEMHMETGHSSYQSEPTHQKDLCCPFCIYHTKNKNNMIDHIILHREERVVPIEVRRPKLSRYLEGIVFRCHQCTFTCGSAEILSAHMMRHDDIKPYRCRLCYFDCTRLSDLEAHLSDKHQVLRNHELVGQVSLDQLEARVGRMPEEDPSDSENDDLKTDELIMDCDEIPRDTTAEPAVHNIEEKITPQIKEGHQKQGPDIKNGNQESPARSSVLHLQYENAKPNTAVQKMHEQKPQEQAGIDTARGQEIENIVRQYVGEGNSAEMQLESCSGPEKEKQTNENQAQPKLGDSEDGSITFTQQKEETDGSSTMYEKAQSNMVHIKAHQHRTLNIEARVEESVLGHTLLLNEDGSSRKIHNEADQDITVKMDQNDDHGTLVHNRKNQVNTEASSASEETNHAHTVERHLLTLKLNCGQLKVSQKEIMGVSITNCKKELAHDPENSEEVTDSYWDMPVLENEYLKEEMHPLGCCKEEEQSDHLEERRDNEDEMITEDDENHCVKQEHEEADQMNEAVNPHGPKGSLTVTDGAAEVLCPATAEEKLFTCEFCGRNLMNSSELERHAMRHGI